MYLLNKELRKDYISFLKTEKIVNIKEYTISNKVESAAFFLLHKFKNKNLNSQLFKCITSPKYSFYYIKHICDNKESRDIISSSNDIQYQTYLGALDNKFSKDLELKILETKKYKLIKLLIDNSQPFHQSKIDDFIINSNKALYIYDALLQAKNKQYYLNKLIRLHKKTYIFKVMLLYPDLNYNKYVDFLVKHNLTKEMRKFVSIKKSELLEGYLLLL